MDRNLNFKLVVFFLASTVFLQFPVLSATARAPRQSTLPLHSVASIANITGPHPAITHQQHVNRGIRRLAMMTKQPVPTENEFMSHLYTRIMGLPDGVRLFAQALNNSSLSKELASVPLNIEANDVGYFCEISIGDPPRPFKVLVDSGSGDLWVGAEGCRADNGGGCFLFYGSGAVAGLMAYDDVALAGLSLTGHKFGIAMNESSDFTPDDIPFDGILGLAKSSISQQKTQTLLEALRDAGEIGEATVSYRISRLADQQNGGDTQGEMTIGGLDMSIVNPDTFVTMKNVNPSGFWEAPMDGMKVNGHDMGWTNRSLVMDTGTTLLIIPEDDSNAIHERITGARLETSSGAWIVPCHTNTSISLTFAGVEFPIDSRDIAWNPIDQKNPEVECYSGIHGGSFGLEPTHWLAGDTFLKNVYFSTNVDTDEISLASLS
ncbi:acid protease [Dendrothele bispora CBS 962.96]|uniref:Acid protease n=1 Tax=Dendrothele bispora (strain CBS 962.96) TaxID=1314807 RepID=A0A4S8MJ77_DENBC|nr:acid protease [Dendrothele bispora CBS 962.96]